MIAPSREGYPLSITSYLGLLGLEKLLPVLLGRVSFHEFPVPEETANTRT